MEAVSRKSSRKRPGKGAASGSSSSRHDPSFQENWKRVLGEWQRKKHDKAMRKTTTKVEVGMDLIKDEVGEELLASEGLVVNLQSVSRDEIRDNFRSSDDDDNAWWADWNDADVDEDPPAPTISEQEAREKMEQYMDEWEKRLLNEMKLPSGEPVLDDNAYRATRFRSDWDRVYGPYYGAFEATTRIPAMRFAFKPPTGGAHLAPTLQVFSVRVELEPRSRLQFPVHVFGLVALRDNIDYNRNLLFQRGRDDCQTLTEEHPCLVLTGPTRAVYLESTVPVTIEVDLRVKSTDDHSEDKQLSFLAEPLVTNTTYSRLWNCDYTSKLSTLHLTLGCIPWSLEATIFVQITSGSWPAGFQGQFSAFAKRSRHELSCPFTDARVDDEEIVLLPSRGESVPVSGDGSIELSRRVVSVQDQGELRVCVKAWRGDNITEKWTVFKVLLAGRSISSIEIDGSCAMDVTVVWSLNSYNNV